jgi:Na+-driven multidrug efflux pump
MAAGWTIANIFFLFFGGLWTSVSILVGGALGAGKLEEARHRAGGDTAMGMYTDVSVNTLFFTPGSILLSLFTAIAPVPMFAILKMTDIVKFFIARYLLHKEKWVRNLTV